MDHQAPLAKRRAAEATMKTHTDYPATTGRAARRLARGPRGECAASRAAAVVFQWQQAAIALAAIVLFWL
ncbi:hypothetical protein BV911_16080 [Pseudoruegeria sp. SK021]|nr:hypothetical protein BV911_16080 [Pseudoruegeria sp. SK021]